MLCQHQPPCPSAEDTDREAAKLVASVPEQGWSLLCNGVIVFDDPDCSVIEPHRGPALHTLVPAA